MAWVWRGHGTVDTVQALSCRALYCPTWPGYGEGMVLSIPCRHCPAGPCTAPHGLGMERAWYCRYRAGIVLQGPVLPHMAWVWRGHGTADTVRALSCRALYCPAWPGY